MSADDNVALIRRMFDEINKGDLESATDMVSEDCVYHTPAGEVSGREEIKEVMSATRNTFPDERYVIDDVFAAGEKVVVRWTYSGTHQAEYRGVAATGKQVAVECAGIFRVAEGRIGQIWAYSDYYGLVNQLR